MLILNIFLILTDRLIIFLISPPPPKKKWQHSILSYIYSPYTQKSYRIRLAIYKYTYIFLPAIFLIYSLFIDNVSHSRSCKHTLYDVFSILQPVLILQIIPAAVHTGPGSLPWRCLFSSSLSSFSWSTSSSRDSSKSFPKIKSTLSINSVQYIYTCNC